MGQQEPGSAGQGRFQPFLFLRSGPKPTKLSGRGSPCLGSLLSPPQLSAVGSLYGALARSPPPSCTAQDVAPPSALPVSAQIMGCPGAAPGTSSGEASYDRSRHSQGLRAGLLQVRRTIPISMMLLKVCNKVLTENLSEDTLMLALRWLWTIRLLSQSH